MYVGIRARAREGRLRNVAMTRKSSSALPGDRRVRRSTFYDHYQDVHELAEAACTSMLDDMFGFVLALDTPRAHPADPPEDPDPALTAFFAHFAEHAGLYRSLLGPAGSARV